MPPIIAVTYGNIDQTRMPIASRGHRPIEYRLTVGMAGVPLTQVYGDQRGQIDPEALRVLAQGGQYDFNARRDAIAPASCRQYTAQRLRQWQQ